MHLRNRTIFFLIILVFLILAGSVLIFLYLSAAQPPLVTISRCTEVLSKARQAEAAEYARDLLTEAEIAYLDAMVAWKIQNTRWYFIRDHSVVLGKLLQVLTKGEAAYRKSIAVKDSMHHDLAVGLAEVERNLRKYAENFRVLPLNSQSRRDFQTAEMLFLEARIAYEQGNYNRVNPKLEKSKILIRDSIRKNRDVLSSYFTNIPKWKQWVDETIEWSRINEKPVIIVDKFAGKCYLYDRGMQVWSFEAEFGINWIGGKKHIGDKATPEGKYYITKKKSEKRTKYYKALLINYPNKEDSARFEEGVRRGLISKWTGIGGLIEIHGE
ncbi:MAG: L,D-transpeptidase family protein, partial [Bacteroidota bacterium]